jgi:hypothetical protein
MKHALLASIAFITLAGSSWAADKPNFTGEWKMNPAKSNYGAFPPPTSMLRKITHTEPTLVIVDDQSGGNQTGITTRKYATDGKPAAFEINGTPVTGAAAWDGGTLLVTTTVDTIGLVFKDKMSVSADGKQLTSNVQIESSQGTAEVTVVFDRQ